MRKQDTGYDKNKIYTSGGVLEGYDKDKLYTGGGFTFKPTETLYGNAIIKDAEFDVNTMTNFMLKDKGEFGWAEAHNADVMANPIKYAALHLTELASFFIPVAGLAIAPALIAAENGMAYNSYRKQTNNEFWQEYYKDSNEALRQNGFAQGIALGSQVVFDETPQNLKEKASGIGFGFGKFIGDTAGIISFSKLATKGIGTMSTEMALALGYTGSKTTKTFTNTWEETDSVGAASKAAIAAAGSAFVSGYFFGVLPNKVFTHPNLIGFISNRAANAGVTAGEVVGAVSSEMAVENWTRTHLGMQPNSTLEDIGTAGLVSSVFGLGLGLLVRRNLSTHMIESKDRAETAIKGMEPATPKEEPASGKRTVGKVDSLEAETEISSKIKNQNVARLVSNNNKNNARKFAVYTGSNQGVLHDDNIAQILSAMEQSQNPAETLFNSFQNTMLNYRTFDNINKVTEAWEKLYGSL